MPLHPSFEPIYNHFLDEYGLEDGRSKYYAWLEAHGLDDTKPLEPQRSKLTDTFFVSPTKTNKQLAEKKIRGIAAYPGQSRNNRFYLKDELMKAHGVTLPVFWDHDYAQPTIGNATLFWDPELELLKYEADVFDLSHGIPDHVSIGAGYDYMDRFLDIDVPTGLSFYELSLTPNPGLPLTTVGLAEKKNFVVEHVIDPASVKARHFKSEMTKGPDSIPLSQSNVAESAPPITVTQTSSGTKNPEEGVTLGVQPEGEVRKMSEEKKVEEKKEEEKPTIPIPIPIPIPKEAVNPWSLTPDQFAKVVEHAVSSGVATALKASNQPIPRAPIGDSSPTGDNRQKRLYENMANLIRRFADGNEGSISQPLGMSFRIPAPILPRNLDERKKWLDELQDRLNRVTEALATTTTGASLGVYGVTPVIVIPGDLNASLMDTVNFVRIPQGSDRARWATIKVAAAVALTENTEPTEATQTLTAPDAVASPRGIQQSVSYELGRKMVGDIMEGVVESFRLSYLQDIDNLVATEGNTGVPAGNTLFGDESVSSEATVTSAMTLAPARIATAIQKITTKGYSPDNLVYVCNPVQFDALLKHADVRQAHIFGEKVQVTGVIPALYGVEVRRSTKLTTGTGSASITTYRSFVYKKGVTFGVGASEDLLIETFRDIRKNQTVVKASWDMAVKTLEADSLVRIITA